MERGGIPQGKSLFLGCPVLPKCPLDVVTILLSLEEAGIGGPSWSGSVMDLQSIYSKNGPSILFSAFPGHNAQNLRPTAVLAGDCPSLLNLVFLLCY